MDLDDDAYMIIVVDDEEEKEPSPPKTSHDCQAGPSGVDSEEHGEVLAGFAQYFSNLGEESEMKKAGWLWLSQPKIWLMVLMGSGVRHCQWQEIGICGCWL